MELLRRGGREGGKEGRREGGEERGGGNRQVGSEVGQHHHGGEGGTSKRGRDTQW